MAIARPIDRRLFFFLDRAHTQMAKAADNFLSTRSGVSTAQAVVLIYLGYNDCLLYTSPSPRDQRGSRMPSSA